MTFPFRFPRVCVVGFGGTGAEIVNVLVRRGRFDLRIVEIREDMALGKSLDMVQSGSLLKEDVHIRVGNHLGLIEGSDIVVVTAGRSRRPGEPREQMLRDNAALVHRIAQETAILAPSSHLIILTNPADLLTRIAFEASGFPSAKVMGQGGILDSARLSTFVADALRVSVQDVQSIVLGGHGDSMVPIQDFVNVRGIPIKHLMSDEVWQDIVERTRFAGEEILKKFETHGASITPGLAVCEMIEALLNPIPRLMPISTLARGQYGIYDVFMGLPALVSHRGVEQIVEIPLSSCDLQRMRDSARKLQHTWNLSSAPSEKHE